MAGPVTPGCGAAERRKKEPSFLQTHLKMCGPQKETERCFIGAVFLLTQWQEGALNCQFVVADAVAVVAAAVAAVRS